MVQFFFFRFYMEKNYTPVRQASFSSCNLYVPQDSILKLNLYKIIEI